MRIVIRRFEQIQKTIQQLNADKEDKLQKLKNKFNKQLKKYKDTIAENEYKISQSEEKLKKNKVALDEWIVKAKQEKDKQQHQLENELDELASKKLKAEKNLANIKQGIKRKLTLKENERKAEIDNLEKEKNNKIKSLNVSISENKSESDKRILNLKNEQTDELGSKGADTTRLNQIDDRLEKIKSDLDYIKNNEHIVFEYKKDKRELFDKVPQLKADKQSLEKKQEIIAGKHNEELNQIHDKCNKQEASVKSIKSQIDEFDTDLQALESFKKSEVFSSIQDYIY